MLEIVSNQELAQAVADRRITGEEARSLGYNPRVISHQASSRKGKADHSVLKLSRLLVES